MNHILMAAKHLGCTFWFDCLQFLTYMMVWIVYNNVSYSIIYYQIICEIDYTLNTNVEYRI